jgi:hypothetical protein
MTEDFLHFIWKYGLFDRTRMITDTGEEVQVIALGEHNANAGPDFLNTRIRIGHTMWAGNVEIHLRSSDWNEHKHNLDKAYDNIILHAVHKNNQRITRSTGEIIPGVELKFDPSLYENYRHLLEQKDWLRCHDKIRQIDHFLLDMWLSSLVVERLQQKAHHIDGVLDRYRNSQEDAFYVTLARSFGFGLNAVPFEMTAKSLPLSSLSRIRNNPAQVEAVLMGQAGFLEEARMFSDYYSGLRKEYLHLKTKFGLKPIEKHLWKFLRLRPVNFPTIRIAQFAAILVRAPGLFSQVLACHKIDELRGIFDVQASSFWDSHYTFESEAPIRVKKLGTDAFQSIVINAVIPFLFVYGQRTGQATVKERAFDWLNQLPPETNRVIKRWNKLGIMPASAFYSQGLLQMSANYCSRKGCLACTLGARLVQG